MNTLKKYNGRVHGNKYKKFNSFSVAAFSMRHAAEIINKVSNACITEYEIKNYYSPMWGNDMKKVICNNPSLYAVKYGKKPILIYKEAI